MSKRSKRGRLVASSSPNQNIPVRTEEGRRLREAFAPQPGQVLVQTDYRALEIRMAAELAKRGGRPGSES